MLPADLLRDVRVLERRVEVLELRRQVVPLPTPTALAFTGTWGNFGGGFEEGEYWKDQFGVVHLRGLVTKTSGLPGASDTIATLPAGHRPAKQLIFVAASGEAFTAARVDIATDGSIIRVASIAAAGETDYTSLTGICFRTDA